MEKAKLSVLKTGSKIEFKFDGIKKSYFNPTYLNSILEIKNTFDNYNSFNKDVMLRTFNV